MRGKLFIDKSFVYGEVKYENGLISSVDILPKDQLECDESNNYIIPGLVDIHIHGCMGVDFCDLAEDKDTDLMPKRIEIIDRMQEYEKSVGVTTIFPTTMTLSEESLLKIMKATADAGGDLLGINLEGPFISYEKKGAQNPDYIRNPDISLVRKLNEACGGLIKIVTVAPEVDNAVEFIRELSGICPGIVCSIAHTRADYDTTMKAFAAGANHVTHLYNAMTPFLNRAPGVIGAAFDDKKTYVEMISDGVHLHPSVVRASFEMFGDDRVVLISDSMMATGMPDGKYSLGRQEVIKHGNLATLADGTIAGSVTNLFDCVKTAIKMGVPKESAILAATKNPAKSVGIFDRVGEIAVGKQANLVVCDSDFNIKEVVCS